MLYLSIVKLEAIRSNCEESASQRYIEDSANPEVLEDKVLEDLQNLSSAMDQIEYDKNLKYYNLKKQGHCPTKTLFSTLSPLRATRSMDKII